MDGRCLGRRQRPVVLRPGASKQVARIDLRREIAAHGRESFYLRIALRIGSKLVSEETVLLTAPRFLALTKVRIVPTIKLLSTRRVELGFLSKHFVHRCWFELPGVAHRADDNAFDLYPGRLKRVLLDFPAPVTIARVQRALRVQSLTDTF
jgi:beta-mannosidase